MRTRGTQREVTSGAFGQRLGIADTKTAITDPYTYRGGQGLIDTQIPTDISRGKVGEPNMETTYIKVPGRSGLIDATEAVSGRRVFTSRSLAFELGGERSRLVWDAVISGFRNNIQGRVCRLILDNDKQYFWRGRVYLEDFDRFRELGTFTLKVPKADPYKYAVLSSAEPWLWDPFNFTTDYITYIGAVTITGSGSITVPAGHMPTTPDIVVSDKVSTNFTVTSGGVMYALTVGTNRIPSIIVGGEQSVQLDFTGSAKVQVVYKDSYITLPKNRSSYPKPCSP